ncbi:MAG: NAD(P)/FAD-dependent oxidoreductase [Candidatus Thioglobus sp.]|uniref:NAD(P)/FAD-dependent oxidoreductase n=1 Tax=Candidatus Thioglobus sp. TaxID=2026721 RepID=UPI002617C251|nr:NAD(P)/FAD-dependent oxidoreductase [Candidatus Thioglobus sp.]MDC9727441.1 NAD(P)/FAD-dependent oxidoreductase [Candidatus Thioglobus sp.]
METNLKKYDVVIIGAGAAGLMCAAQAQQRGRKVLILDKANKAGKKILISGGGRCNFTNLHIEPQAFLSENVHFCKSALSRYTQWDFMALMQSHHLSWQEKSLGQLFCDQKSGAILRMLLDECQQTDFVLDCNINNIKFDSSYLIQSDQGEFESGSLVVATGGPSIPKMGATDFGLTLAKQFNLSTRPFKPALVPFTFHQHDINTYFKDLSGLSLDAVVTCQGVSFREALLITHRGLSGPAILQASSYWQPGDCIEINLLPDIDASEYLLDKQQSRGKAELKTILGEFFPKRLAERLANTLGTKLLADTTLGEIKHNDLKAFGQQINHWLLVPSGTEGLRVAEVCTGGIDTNELSSKTMESNKQPGLYFIGETVDVTGWLGGYNFQWAWSSGWAAGQVV